MQPLLESFRELIARRGLLFAVALREIQVKYKQSVMGFLWAVFMPIVIVSAGLVVRFAFSTISGKPLELSDLTSVAVKAAPWAFFVAALRSGTNSLVANANLITKIYVPRLIFPLSSVTSQLFDFLVACTVVVLLLVVAQAGLSIQLLWLPLLVGPLVLLATSLAVIFSAGSLFLRDVKYLVEVLLTFAIFFTPVLYDASIFGKWAPVLLINPVSPILEGLSSTVVRHAPPDLPWLAYSIACSLVFFVGSITAFKRFEPYFAECI